MRSELCVFDLEHGTTDVILTHEGIIEAPNWHPDGYLIVNGDGLLYRVPLDAPELIQIDTGFATTCNNDHGISPDGRLLAISDRSRTEKPVIYTLPVTGGDPHRVTEKMSCYWHGWSPDGATLAYVGYREDRFVLLTCPVKGGEEFCVTDAFDHVDGPDYTADGAWIWFNGERDGAVDLWRIRPDGSDMERMTDGATVDWFPHPSPDGQHILYLAYPQGTEGHPPGLNVTLKLMPAEGGVPRDLVALFGGQGTINVPCWAPDSRRFAFMRFSPTD